MATNAISEIKYWFASLDAAPEFYSYNNGWLVTGFGSGLDRHRMGITLEKSEAEIAKTWLASTGAIESAALSADNQSQSNIVSTGINNGF